ncbi:unnamed protein product [Echinostoma caproni]|uniref:ClpP/crotonase n=1 Tax=Echinostoma caproni TaxID=27848 RepID=A0A183B1U5_9TREM|nr:unnamed protein product [Echinostoma caproni]
MDGEPLKRVRKSRKENSNDRKEIMKQQPDDAKATAGWKFKTVRRSTGWPYVEKEEAQSQYVKLISDLVANESDVPKSDSVPITESGDGLDCFLDRGVLTLRLNRPEKKNAITPKMYRMWTEKLSYASSDFEVKLVVVTGTGDYFSSGNDLTTFLKPIQSGVSIAQVAREGRDILREFVASFIDCTKPLIACVNGPAVGISVTTLGLYDLVLAADNAHPLDTLSHHWFNSTTVRHLSRARILEYVYSGSVYA